VRNSMFVCVCVCVRAGVCVRACTCVSAFDRRCCITIVGECELVHIHSKWILQQKAVSA